MYNLSIKPISISEAAFILRVQDDTGEFHALNTETCSTSTFENRKDHNTPVATDASCRSFQIIADGKCAGVLQLTNITESTAEYKIFADDNKEDERKIFQQYTYQVLHFAKEELLLKQVYCMVRDDYAPEIDSLEKCSFVKGDSENGWTKMVYYLERLDAPTVSVFVMVYNHEKYLSECLDGILMQKCGFTFNIVVGEDCSSDRSRSILLEYRRKYPGKFKLLLHESNVGAVRNQSMVFSECDGLYIALCEGDDYWTDPLKLQKQVDFLECNKEYSMYFHAADYLYDKETQKPYLRRDIESRAYTGNEILNNWIVPTASVVFRREYLTSEVMTRLANKKYIYGDIILFLSMSLCGKLYGDAQLMSVYRIHEGGMLKSSAQLAETAQKYIMHHKEMARDFNGDFKSLNYVFISNKYYELCKSATDFITRMKHFYNFNKYAYLASRRTALSGNHIKTALYLLLHAGKNEVIASD